MNNVSASQNERTLAAFINPSTPSAKILRYGLVQPEGTLRLGSLLKAIEEPDEPFRRELFGPVSNSLSIDLDPSDTTDHVAEHTEHARTRKPQPVIPWYMLVPPSRYIELDREA